GRMMRAFVPAGMFSEKPIPNHAVSDVLRRIVRRCPTTAAVELSTISRTAPRAVFSPQPGSELATTITRVLVEAFSSKGAAHSSQLSGVACTYRRPRLVRGFASGRLSYAA